MALTEAAQEAIWLKAFLCELGEISLNEAVKIYEDNRGLIPLTKNPECHKRTKHIDISLSLRAGEGQRRSRSAPILLDEGHEGRLDDEAN